LGAMAGQQKTLDTLATETYTDVVSSHTKSIRRVRELMNQATGSIGSGVHPCVSVMGWPPPCSPLAFDRKTIELFPLSRVGVRYGSKKLT
jgi:hypothetical protein